MTTSRFNKGRLRRWAKWIIVGGLVSLVLIQLIPIDRTNPPVEEAMPAPADVQAVLDRSCADCHSNKTEWPLYSRIAPISWLVAHDVDEGRSAFNYSAWNRFNAEDRAEVLEDTGHVVAEGEMPPAYYRLMHPQAALSDADIETLRAWAGVSGESESDEN